VTLRKTLMEANARAQNSERELTPSPQSSAAIRDFAQDVDGSGRKGFSEERELTVPRPQSSAAVRDFAQDVDGSER